MTKKKLCPRNRVRYRAPIWDAPFFLLTTEHMFGIMVSGWVEGWKRTEWAREDRVRSLPAPLLAESGTAYEKGA